MAFFSFFFMANDFKTQLRSKSSSLKDHLLVLGIKKVFHEDYKYDFIFFLKRERERVFAVPPSSLNELKAFRNII